MADIEWRAPTHIYMIAIEILGEIMEEPEDSERREVLLDDLWSLPGAPLRIDPERDTLILTEVGSARVAVPRFQFN